MERYIPFQEYFLAINIFIHVQVGYLLLWLFGGTPFNLLIKWCVEKLPELSYYGLQHWNCGKADHLWYPKTILLISVCAQRRAYHQHYMKVLMCADMEIHTKSGISSILSCYSLTKQGSGEKRDNRDSDMPITLS